MKLIKKELNYKLHFYVSIPAFYKFINSNFKFLRASKTYLIVYSH